MRHHCWECGRDFDCGVNDGSCRGGEARCWECNPSGMWRPEVEKFFITKKTKGQKGKFYVAVKGHRDGGEGMNSFEYGLVVREQLPQTVGAYENLKDAQARMRVMRENHPEAKYWVVYIEAAPDSGRDCPYAPFEGRG